ncbi:transmembrane protein 127-like [Sycon ciliatum]|uniref:transmembrane protein 127-like n=1 Tax=Sycon ciliatum TaxID=27933 RepID=UPI0020ABFAFD|eukprot:scpid68742/ scgid32072/ 
MDSSVLYSSNHRRRFPKPARERHPVSAALSLSGMICLIIALVEPRWSKRGTKPCIAAVHNKVCVSTMGLFHNDFSVKPFSSNTENKYLVAATVFCCLLSSVWLLMAFILSSGYPRQRLACMRHNAIGNILGVLCSVMGCSLWFWCTSNISRISGYEDLRFDTSFYLVVSAAACAVVAGAINLLRFKPYSQTHRNQMASTLSTSENAMLNLLAEVEDNTQNSSLPSYQP